MRRLTALLAALAALGLAAPSVGTAVADNFDCKRKIKFEKDGSIRETNKPYCAPPPPPPPMD